jgi:hypothetical protein
MPETPINRANITPECRTGRGDEGAWDEAVQRLRATYEQVVDGWRDEPEQPTLNLILTMERPGGSDDA